jgi:hypothetical protein
MKRAEMILIVVVMILFAVVTIETFRILGTAKPNIERALGIVNAANGQRAASNCGNGQLAEKNLKQLKEIAKVFQKETDKYNKNNERKH